MAKVNTDIMFYMLGFTGTNSVFNLWSVPWGKFYYQHSPILQMKKLRQSANKWAKYANARWWLLSSNKAAHGIRGCHVGEGHCAILNWEPRKGVTVKVKYRLWNRQQTMWSLGESILDTEKTKHKSLESGLCLGSQEKQRGQGAERSKEANVEMRDRKSVV